MNTSKVVRFRINGEGQLIAVLADGASMNARNSKHLKVGDDVTYSKVKAGDKYLNKEGNEVTNERDFNRFEGFVPAEQKLNHDILSMKAEITRAQMVI